MLLSALPHSIAFLVLLFKLQNTTEIITQGVTLSLWLAKWAMKHQTSQQLRPGREGSKESFGWSAGAHHPQRSEEIVSSKSSLRKQHFLRRPILKCA